MASHFRVLPENGLPVSLLFMLFGNLTLLLIDGVCRYDAAHGRQRINVGMRTDDSSRIQDRATAHLYLIAKHGAEFLDTGFDISLRSVNLYQLLIGFYVRSDGACAIWDL